MTLEELEKATEQIWDYSRNMDTRKDSISLAKRFAREELEKLRNEYPEFISYEMGGVDVREPIDQAIANLE